MRNETQQTREKVGFRKASSQPTIFLTAIAPISRAKIELYQYGIDKIDNHKAKGWHTAILVSLR
ncbi:hypothetical protein [Nostoc sp.]|uniref:hypothetical protein n=1 Tax=Nostoc sp. TaxID=1180 RepID=UPI002FFBD262